MITIKELDKYRKEKQAKLDQDTILSLRVYSLPEAAISLNQESGELIELSKELLFAFSRSIKYSLEDLAKIADYRSHDWQATLRIWKRIIKRG